MRKSTLYYLTQYFIKYQLFFNNIKNKNYTRAN